MWPWPPSGAALGKQGRLTSVLISAGASPRRKRGRNTAYTACPSPEPASGKRDGGEKGWEKERKEGDTQRALLGAKGTHAGLCDLEQ